MKAAAASLFGIAAVALPCHSENGDDGAFTGSLRRTAGLQAVMLGESSGVLRILDFDPAGRELADRRGELSVQSNDFREGQAVYDVFYSREDGTPDLDGSALTIEVGLDPLASGSHRSGGIAFAALRFDAQTKIFADRVFSLAAGPGFVSGSERLAVDDDEQSSADPGELRKDRRLRLTFGFRRERLAERERREPRPEGAPQIIGGKLFTRAAGSAFSLAEVARVKPGVRVSRLVPFRTPDEKWLSMLLVTASESAGKPLWWRRTFIDQAPVPVDLESSSVPLGLDSVDGFPVMLVQGRRIVQLRPDQNDQLRVAPWGDVPPGTFSEILVANLDGNPPDDLLLFSGEDGSIRARMQNSMSPPILGPLQEWLMDAGLKGAAPLLKVADLDQDGLDDLIIVLPDARLQVVLTRPEHRPLPLGWYVTTDARRKVSDAWLAKTDLAGAAELLLRQEGGLIGHIHFQNGSLVSAVPLSFQSLASRFDAMVSGDFDGDGSPDLLALPHFGRDWLLSASSGGFVHVSSAHLEKLAGKPELVTAVADLNGDGLDDLAAFDDETGSLLIATSQMSVPVGGMQLRIGEHKTVLTGSDGSFSAALPDGVNVVDVSAGEPTVSPERIRVVRRGTPSAVRKNLFLLPFKRDEPRVCLGYPGTVDGWGAVYGECPQGYAFYAADDPSSMAPLNPLQGTCCPLPKPDLLTGEHRSVSDHCPDGWVVTGGSGYPEGDWQNRFLFRCTRLNEKRYQLGPVSAGLYWGIGYSVSENSARVDRSVIPAGLRFGVGRLAREKWDIDGCIGKPWGSLLVSGRSRRCSDFQFREVQYSGADGDPPQGTPIRMFADCATVADIFDPLSACGEPPANADRPSAK